MSFLESIQHGLEKASREAARITKIRRLQNVVDNLSFKSAQEGQNLIARALELYRNGQLPQGELAEICQQITTYQQQISEVQVEIQKPHEEQEEPPAPPAPPAPGYAPQPYPPAPGYAPQPYPPYAAPASGYAAYQAAPPTYPGYANPAPSSGEVPTKPGSATVETQAPPKSSEVPTKPGSTPKATHKSKETPKANTGAPAETRGSYEEGVLPPVYSPFATQKSEKKTETSEK